MGHKTWMTSVTLEIYLWRAIFLFICKESVTFVHGLAFYVKEWLPFIFGLSLKNSEILNYVLNQLQPAFCINHCCIYWHCVRRQNKNVALSVLSLIAVICVPFVDIHLQFSLVLVSHLWGVAAKVIFCCQKKSCPF